ncbi:unnamed protein product [Lathyrus oleraceus]
MKLGSILLIVCVLFALLSHTYGSPTPVKDADDVDFCPKSLTTSGTCSDSSRTCWDELNAAYGASGMVHQCSCKGLADNKRICTCLVRSCQK